MPMATINYNIADHGTHYVVKPACYFPTEGNKARVKLEKDENGTATGKLIIKPKLKPRLDKMNPDITKQVLGGYLFLPKKADLSRDIAIRHEGPQGQMLAIDVPKKVEA